MLRKCMECHFNLGCYKDSEKYDCDDRRDWLKSHGCGPSYKEMKKYQICDGNCPVPSKRDSHGICKKCRKYKRGGK